MGLVKPARVLDPLPVGARRSLEESPAGLRGSETVRAAVLTAPATLVTGFVARSPAGDTVLLGRGSSDTTASYLAGRASAGGIEISLRPMADYVKLARPCRFDDLVHSAQQRMEIALGFRTWEDEASGGARVEINPARDETWRFTDSDRIVVLAQEIYR